MDEITKGVSVQKQGERVLSLLTSKSVGCEKKVAKQTEKTMTGEGESKSRECGILEVESEKFFKG